ncbi:MAG: helix-turn-helix transcriptional regulator [Pseudomonadota bacterium]
MNDDFSLDLKVARKKAGFTQRDIAHLLNTNHSKVSKLENGQAVPSIREICGFSLIYGRSFESLFGVVIEDMHRLLQEQIPALPACHKNWLGQFNRSHSIDQLAARLNGEPMIGHEPA